jgi:FAD:protein FMN transferase
MEYHSFTAMSTNVLAAAQGSLPKINEGFRRMEELVHACEQRFTRFSAHSELSAFNRSAGRWFDVSSQMYEVLHLARQFYYDTGGLFDPGVLGSLEAVGYNRSIEQVLPGVPAAPAQPQASLSRPCFGDMELADDRLAARLPPGLRIDLGGIAKGWIAEQAARLLSRYVSACGVNAGGDQFTIGLPAGEEGWEVGLEDPFHPDQDLATLLLKPGAVATSSIIKRRWKQGESQRHHLIDPRSGLPAQTPWASVTVITDTAAKAEVLSKALLIAGEEGAPALMARHPQAAFMVVDMQGNFFGSENSKEHLYANYRQPL